MKLWKRAFLYTARKKGKTLILFFILFVMATFVLTGFSILSAVDRAALSLRQSVGGCIKLERDESKSGNWTYQQGAGGTLVGYTGEPITDREIHEIMQVEGIRDYNGIGDGSVFARDFSFISGFQFSPGSDYSRLPSVTNSAYFNYFSRGAFKLVQGRHIGPEDDHAVLISTALAEHNGLKLGDTITVQCDYDAGGYPDVALRIVGIYECMLEEEPFNTTSTDKRNRLIVDHKAMQDIMRTDRIQYDNGVEFFVDDPEETGRIVSDIQKLDLNWDCFKLSVDNTAYEAVAAPLTAMQSMVKGLIVGVSVAGVGILTLILNMWIRQRRHETGILLSVGVAKAEVIAQYAAEALGIAIIAFGLSWFSGNAAAQGVSNLFLRQATQAQPEAKVELPDDGTEYMDITGRYIPYEPSGVTAPDRISVHVAARHLFLMSLLGSASLLSAVVLASRPVLKMKPKNILSEMS